MSSLVHLHLVKLISTWISSESIFLCSLSCYNHCVKLYGCCEVTLIPKYIWFALLSVSFPHFYFHVFVPSQRSSALHHFGGLWWSAVTLLSVYIRRKSNAGLVALQECCPPAFSPSPSFVCPICVLIHCFPLSLLFFFFYIPSCLCFKNYSLRTITFHDISHFSLLFIPALSLNS